MAYAQDVSAVAKVGQTVTFDVTASGTAPFIYQWKKEGTNIAGATSISYVVANITTADAGNYTVEVSNSLGTTLSNIATLTIMNAPVFTLQPVASTVPIGKPFTLVSLATADATLTYQWFKNNVAITGATSATYTISSPTLSDSGTYKVVATNTFNGASVSTDSNSVSVTVVEVLVTPTFTNQPVATTTVNLAQPFTLSGLATGAPTPTYQWYKDNTIIIGATSTSYTISSAVSANAGTYILRATSTLGGTSSSTDSNPATVNVVRTLAAPTFSSQPSSTSVNLTQSFVLTGTATGIPPPTYQWYKDNAIITGATSTSYIVNSAVSADAGLYILRATSSIDGVSSSTDSNTATINVVRTLRPPVFTTHPVSTSVDFGKTLTLTSSASTAFYFYTVGTDNNIYEISDIGTKRAVRDVSTIVGATPSNAINGAAFDSARRQFFFAAPNPSGSGVATLWYWNQATNATPVNLGQLTTSRPDNGAYWNNAYWYIMPGTQTLVRVALQYDVSGNPAMVSGGISSATITGGVPTPNNNYIGDIAITGGGTLYATTSNGASFYTFNLPSGALSGSVVATSLGSVGSPIIGRLQIAFGPSDITLYGQSFDTGQWYTVNTTNGTLTQLAFSTLINGGPTGFQDISGISAAPTPPATDSGTGTIAYQWFRNDVAIAGATSSTYTVASAVMSTGGTYKVTATRTFDGLSSSTDSAPALVTITGVTAPSNVRIIVSVIDFYLKETFLPTTQTWSLAATHTISDKLYSDPVINGADISSFNIGKSFDEIWMYCVFNNGGNGGSSSPSPIASLRDSNGNIIAAIGYKRLSGRTFHVMNGVNDVVINTINTHPLENADWHVWLHCSANTIRGWVSRTSSRPTDAVFIDQSFAGAQINRVRPQKISRFSVQGSNSPAQQWDNIIISTTEIGNAP